MKISGLTLLRGVGWTAVAFGIAQALRLVTNIVLARLLAPELFGIMVIVNNVRTGVELFSDVGISQNIVHNRNSEKPEFYNTAWTLRLIRGVILFAVCSALAYPIALFYQAPVLAYALPATALAFVIAGFYSIGPYILNKQVRFVRLNAAEMVLESISSAAHILLAYLSQTIWALIFAGLISSTARLVVSHMMVPGIRHRFYISWDFAREMFRFGKWIAASSFVFFFSTNIDRLFLGKAGSLEMLGIYGIAKTISEITGALVVRMCTMLVFPLVAASRDVSREQLHKRVGAIRLKSLLVVALGLSLLTSSSDIIISVLYDSRYQAAGWMLPILMAGTWISCICSINESIMMGLGKPSYGAIGSAAKLAWFMVGLPIGYQKYGVLGVAIVASLSEIFRYFPVLMGQLRERFSFVRQDIATTAVFCGLVGCWEWLRWMIGFKALFVGFPFF